MTLTDGHAGDAHATTWSCPACGAVASVPRWPRRGTRTQEQSSDTFVPSSDQFGATVGSLRRCTACGHAALEQPPVAGTFDDTYKDAADEISLSEEAGQVLTASRDLAEIERWVAPGRLLDVGCWTGSLLVAARERGWEAEGIEPSAWAVDRARERGCTVVHGTLDDADLTGSYRAVVACDVIEHLVDPLSMVTQLTDALEPGGVLLLTVPDAGSRLARVLGPRWWSVLPMHLQYFTRASMERVLARGGLQVLGSRTHPKAFSASYYADRLAAFLPVGGRAVSTVVDRLGVADRMVAPDLRDRLAIVAQKPRRG